MSVSLAAELVVTGVLLGLVYAAVAIGLSLTMGMLHVFNLTHGVFIVGGALLIWQGVEWGLPLPVAVAATFALLFLAGVLIEGLLVASKAEEDPFGGLLILFGLLVVIESGAALIWTADFKALDLGGLERSVDLGVARVTIARLVAAAIAIVAIAALWIFLTRTLTGKAIRAVSQKPEAARILGIEVTRVRTLVFGLGTGLAAVGAVTVAMVFTFAPQTNFRWLVWAILVVIVGGMGSVQGTVLAAIGLGLVEAFGGELLPFEYVHLLIYGLLVAALFWRGSGLMAGAERRV